MDHGFGAAGVALNSAPTEGVPVVPLTQVRSTFPVLKNPANRHKAVGYDFEHWNYAFTNTLPDDEARTALRAVRGAGVRPHPVRERAREPRARARGDLRRLPQRPAGAAAVRGRQRGPHHAAEGAVVERRALPVRAHAHRGRRVRGQAAPPAVGPGLGADRGLRPRLGGPAGDRAVRRRRRAHAAGAPSRDRTRHERGPPHPHRRPHPPDRVRGLAAADRPDVRPAGPALRLRLGHLLPQDRRPGASTWPSSATIDAVLLTHDHHGDNLDDAGPRVLAGAAQRAHHDAGRPTARRRCSATAPPDSRAWSTTTLGAPGAPPSR